MANAPPKWIVILCPPRSSSTVVTAMLGCHPEMYAFPEFHLFSMQTIEALLAEDKRISVETGIRFGYTAGVIRALIELKGLRRDESGVTAALDWLRARAQWTNYDLLDSFQEAIHPRTAVAKSTHVGQDPAALRRLRSTLPSTRFIHLIRHPLATLRSQLGVTAKTEPHATKYAGYFAHVLLHHHRLIEAFLCTLPSTDWIRVRAEDALSKPPVLAQLAEKMGRRTDQVALDAMRHPENWPFASPGPTPLQAEGDLGFYSSPSLRPRESEMACVPSEWKLGPEIRADLAKLALDSGYLAGWGPGK